MQASTISNRFNSSSAILRGFTLIELMTVLVIPALAITLAGPGFSA